MKGTMKLFGIGLRQIKKDGMLLVLLPLPLLVGVLFRFALPLANGIAEEKLAFSFLPWYGLVDGMLLCLTPMLVAMVSAFLLLDERSEGVSAFYGVTPVGGWHYLAARVGLPMVWAFLTTVIIGAAFHSSVLPLSVLLMSSFVSTLTGMALAMLLVSLAKNRVEGLALSKLMGLSFLGLLLIWFVPAPYSYLCAFLPSFWVGKLIMEGADPLAFLLGTAICLLWIFLFSRRFLSQMG